MNTISEQYEDKINGTFSFFDRIIIKGHIRQFFSTSGKRYFLSEHNVLLKDFPAFAEQITGQFCDHQFPEPILQLVLSILFRNRLDIRNDRTDRKQLFSLFVCYNNTSKYKMEDNTDASD